MTLEYTLPPLTEAQKRNARRLLKHAIIPEQRTLYFDTRDSMRRFLTKEMQRTGKTISDIAAQSGLPEADITRLCDTGEGGIQTIIRTFKAFGIDVISIPAK